MSNKGKNKNTSYIILIVILLIGIVGVFFLLEGAKKEQAKILSNKKQTTTYNFNDPNNKLIAKKFSVALSDVIYGREFKGNYKESFVYNNTYFDFNCNDFNYSDNVCDEGSGLMRYNDITIPLFTFDNRANNYLTFAKDYYINIEDEYIFLTMNHVGVSSGRTLIYKIDGTLIGDVKNTVTGYKINDELIDSLYPSYQDNTLSFYYADNQSIKIGKVDISDISRKVELENVSGATLN